MREGKLRGSCSAAGWEHLLLYASTGGTQWLAGILTTTKGAIWSHSHKHTIVHTYKHIQPLAK